MLKWSPANAKIKALAVAPELATWLNGKRKIFSLDLLSGWSCPFAKDCSSKVHESPNGRRTLKDGPDTIFRCFSASQEVIFPHVYNSRKHNFDLLRAAPGVLGKYNLLADSMPGNLGICRIHVGGDFFSQEYFDAWIKLAEANQDRLFYGYTKGLPYWLAYKSPNHILDNLVLTASRGGRCDNLIGKHRLREAVVLADPIIVQAIVDSGDYNNYDGMEIDHSDIHAADPGKRRKSFGLLIHNIQPAGSGASKSVSLLNGNGSYTR